LCRGRIRKQDDVILEAHSSSTLVKTGEHNIVVDTSSPQNREAIIRELERLHVAAEDVDFLVITHSHWDHLANNDLFPQARLVMHPLEAMSPSVMSAEDGMSLCVGVTVIHTPGHTQGSISVVVDAEKRYVMAGDALPTEDNYRKWVPPRLNYDPEIALKSMKRIVDMAEVIVPGHGQPFQVDDRFMASRPR